MVFIGAVSFIGGENLSSRR